MAEECERLAEQCERLADQREQATHLRSMSARRCSALRAPDRGSPTRGSRNKRLGSRTAHGNGTAYFRCGAFGAACRRQERSRRAGRSKRIGASAQALIRNASIRSAANSPKTISERQEMARDFFHLSNGLTVEDVDGTNGLESKQRQDTL